MQLKDLTVILLLTIANGAFAMQEQKQKETQEQLQSKANKIYYITAKISIDSLQAKAEAGDMGSALAVYDFYENLKDSNYKIDYPSSKKLLNDLRLLDSNGKVHNATREAFKEYGKIE